MEALGEADERKEGKNGLQMLTREEEAAVADAMWVLLLLPAEGGVDNGLSIQTVELLRDGRSIMEWSGMNAKTRVQVKRPPTPTHPPTMVARCGV